MTRQIFVLIAGMAAMSGPLSSRQSTYTQYTQPVFDSIRQSTEVAQHLREMAIEEQQLAEQRRHDAAEEALERRALESGSVENLSYRGVHSNEAQWRLNQDVKDAIAACRNAHDDCEKLDGMMQVVSKALRPDWTQLSMKEYVECLYSVAKNAGFAEEARNTVLNAAKPLPR